MILTLDRMALDDVGLNLRRLAEAIHDQLRSLLRTEPDLNQVVAMAAAFDISREVTARRYVELHSEALAVVCAVNGRYLYASRSDAFPALSLRRNQPMPIAAAGDEGQVTPSEDGRCGRVGLPA